MTTSATATARFEARIPKHIHDTIKLASQMTGRTMTDFVMSLAYQEAQKTIEKEQDWLAFLNQLSTQDQEQFADNLLNPPPMNDAMKRAMTIHDTFFKDSIGKSI